MDEERPGVVLGNCYKVLWGLKVIAYVPHLDAANHLIELIKANYAYQVQKSMHDGVLSYEKAYVPGLEF